MKRPPIHPLFEAALRAQFGSLAVLRLHADYQARRQERIAKWLLWEDWLRRPRLAPSRVSGQHNNGTGADPVAASFPGSSSAGNLLIAVLAVRNATLSPPAGWTLALDLGVYSSSRNGYIYYAANASAQTTVSFGTGGGTEGTICIAEYSGIATVSPLDVAPAAVGGTSTTPASASSGTLAQASELCISGIACGATVVVNFSLATGGFAIYENQSVSTPSAALLDQVVSSTNAVTAGCTISASQAWRAGVVSFKAAASGPQPLSHLTPLW